MDTLRRMSNGGQKRQSEDVSHVVIGGLIAGIAAVLTGIVGISKAVNDKKSSKLLC